MKVATTSWFILAALALVTGWPDWGNAQPLRVRGFVSAQSSVEGIVNGPTIDQSSNDPLSTGFLQVSSGGSCVGQSCGHGFAEFISVAEPGALSVYSLARGVGARSGHGSAGAGGFARFIVDDIIFTATGGGPPPSTATVRLNLDMTGIVSAGGVNPGDSFGTIGLTIFGSATGTQSGFVHTRFARHTSGATTRDTNIFPRPTTTNLLNNYPLAPQGAVDPPLPKDPAPTAVENFRIQSEPFVVPINEPVNIGIALEVSPRNWVSAGGDLEPGNSTAGPFTFGRTQMAIRFPTSGQVFDFLDGQGTVNSDYGRIISNQWTPPAPILSNDSLTEAEISAQLTTGSTVSLSQTVWVPDSAFDFTFDYRFTTTTGELKVLLDDVPLGSFVAPATVQPDIQATVSVNDPVLLGQPRNLQFLLDGPSGSDILLDNIDFSGIFNGDFQSGPILLEENVITGWAISTVDGGMVSPVISPILGDFNSNGVIDSSDIDLLSEAVRDGETSAIFDLNRDGTVSQGDRDFWVHEVKNTYFGDSNLDGEFNSSDFTAVFRTGKYEDDDHLNSTWSEGDWSGDADFNSGDFVAAFSDGGYELGPRMTTSDVPEGSCDILLAIGFVALCRFRFPRSRRSRNGPPRRPGEI